MNRYQRPVRKSRKNQHALHKVAVDDLELVALGKRFEEIRGQYLKAIRAYGRAEFSRPDARVRQLDNVVQRYCRQLLRIQYKIVMMPAQDIPGLRVKAVVFAAGWKSSMQMRQWMVSRNGPDFQDPQMLMAASLTLDLLKR
jgi:hypothetical protein